MGKNESEQKFAKSSHRRNDSQTRTDYMNIIKKYVKMDFGQK